MKIKIILIAIIVLFSSCELFITDHHLYYYIENQLEIIKENDIEKYEIIMSAQTPNDVHIIINEIISRKKDFKDSDSFNTFSKTMHIGYADCEEFSLITGFLLYYLFNIESLFVVGKFENQTHAFLKSYINECWLYWDPRGGFTYNPIENTGYKVLYEKSLKNYLD